MDQCTKCGLPSPANAMGSSRPQNRYLGTLLDEFEKATQQSSDLSKLQKEYQTYRRELSEAQREIKELKADKQLQTDKINTLQKELAEQKMLHLQLRDEASNEFRSLYRKNGSRDKDINMLKYQNRMSVKKMTFDMENLKWELTNLGGSRINARRTSSETTNDDISRVGISDLGNDFKREMSAGLDGETSRR